MTDATHGHHGESEPSRALVPLEGTAPEGAAQAGVRDGRPLATFVAQLLACRSRTGDFRRHRRAQPPTAAAAYGTAPGAGPARRFERRL